LPPEQLHKLMKEANDSRWDTAFQQSMQPDEEDWPSESDGSDCVKGWSVHNTEPLRNHRQFMQASKDPDDPYNFLGVLGDLAGDPRSEARLQRRVRGGQDALDALMERAKKEGYNGGEFARELMQDEEAYNVFEQTKGGRWHLGDVEASKKDPSAFERALDVYAASQNLASAADEEGSSEALDRELAEELMKLNFMIKENNVTVLGPDDPIPKHLKRLMTKDPTSVDVISDADFR